MWTAPRVRSRYYDGKENILIEPAGGQEGSYVSG